MAGGRLVTARNTRRAPSTPTSDMTSERGEKPGVNASVQAIGIWEPPPASDRELVRDGLERNGAHDLAEILGLCAPREAA